MYYLNVSEAFGVKFFHDEGSIPFSLLFELRQLVCRGTEHQKL